MSKSIYELFGSEKDLEEEGAWIPIKSVRFSDGTYPEFKVRRIGGNGCPFSAEQERLLAPHRKQLRKLRNSDEKLSPEIESWAAKEAFVRVALVDWKNFPKNIRAREEKGELLEYSKENAKNLMNDIPELCAYLIGEAVDKKYYQDEDRDEDSKNY